jgi:hypothetical protein
MENKEGDESYGERRIEGEHNEEKEKKMEERERNRANERESKKITLYKADQK